MAEQTYHSLLASLPHLSSPFVAVSRGAKPAVEPPLSRFQLDRRLSALGFDQRQLLNDIEILMHWDREEKHQLPDADLIRKTHQVRDRVKSQVLRDLINWRLDMRTAVAALRLKRAGHKAPSAPQWSFGTRYEYIRRCWGVPYFNLQFTFPWLPDVARCMEENSSLELEKTLMQAVWTQLDRVGRAQGASFEAVVIYVLRWSLVNRWAIYDSEQALARFDELADNALGDSLKPVDAYE